jgi:hypothetical protein
VPIREINPHPLPPPGGTPVSKEEWLEEFIFLYVRTSVKSTVQWRGGGGMSGPLRFRQFLLFFKGPWPFELQKRFCAAGQLFMKRA